jgi:hypothetical protein
MALETEETHIAVLGNKCNNNPSNVSDLIQPEPYNGDVSLREGIPVFVGHKIVGRNAVNHHPVATKRIT